jgi:mRNA-degrading endonuclease RelE of RelBE toxin-antitoxin system
MSAEGAGMFEIIFTESALGDLQHLRKAEQSLVTAAAERQLTKDPLTPTHNRKPLRPNDLSQWELRTGSYRIFYDVDEQGLKVTIKAIGVKEHNRLMIRGKEYLL